MSKKKILIIDDNSMIRDLFATDLEDDYEVELASNGEEGLAAAAEKRPDVIILDINMPDMSGIEVTRQLELSEETRNIPVVIITASEYNDHTKNELLPCTNFRGFLSKMTPSEDIRKILKKALDGSRR